MKSDGSRLPPSWGPWLAPLLWFSLLFCLLAAASPLHGQTQSERLASIERELLSSLTICGQLSDELRAQSGRLESLSFDLAALRAQLEISARKLSDLESELAASKQLSTDLQQEIARLKDLLRTSQTRLDELSQTFERYRQAQEKVVNGLERQVLGWKVGAVVASVLALVAGGFAVFK